MKREAVLIDRNCEGKMNSPSQKVKSLSSSGF